MTYSRVPQAAAPRPAGLPDGFRWCPVHGEAFHPAMACKGCREAGTALPVVPTATAARAWSSATPTTCERGHRHASKVEARVCPRLHSETTTGTVYRNVRLPLFALPPTAAGIPLYLNVDFVVVVDRRIVRIVDAKSGRISRDWRRGAAACEATYGLKVEEMS